MDHIQKALANTRRNIELVGADPVTRHRFTQVPNFILTNKELSVGAKLAYAMLLKYAWQDDYCFSRPAKTRRRHGGRGRSVRTYLNELETAGFLEVKQRGARQDQPVSSPPNGEGKWTCRA
ncbi:MAG: hypothetical protein M5U16_14255 [Hyphomicrobium sp.]|nr:hypothetical protein [Hyphomicrobium sp.]